MSNVKNTVTVNAKNIDHWRKLIQEIENACLKCRIKGRRILAEQRQLEADIAAGLVK